MTDNEIKGYRKKIITFFLMSFLIPPPTWFALNWYEGTFTTPVLLHILTFPIIYIYIILFVGFSYWNISRKLNQLVHYVRSKRTDDDNLNAQKILKRLQVQFLIELLVYVIIGPVIVMESIRNDVDTVDYIVSWLSGPPLIFLYSSPFMIGYLLYLERLTTSLPFLDKFRAFTFAEKNIIIIGQNAVGAIFVTMIYAYHIAHKFRGSEDFLNILISGLAVTGGSSLLIMILNQILFLRLFAKPISNLRNSLLKLSAAEADLTASLALMSRDELGETAYAFNHFVETIREIVFDAKAVAATLMDTGNNMVQITRKFEDSAKSQMTAVEEISASMEEIGADVEGIAEFARTQSTDVKGLVDMLQDWGKITGRMDETIDSTVLITTETAVLAKKGNSTLEETERDINEIADSAERISQVVLLIEDIADKIELLSLNAAIEAARAGETGRGFAVVAQEVSKLAEMTSSSIKEISSLVEKNHSQVAKGVESMQDTAISISKIHEGISKISMNFQDLGNLMKEQVTLNNRVQTEAIEVNHKAQQISESTKEQRKNIESIMKSLSDISTVSGDISSGAEQITERAVENEDLARQLLKGVQRFYV
jgi:methyl-accepting chemotaxis protein